MERVRRGRPALKPDAHRNGHTGNQPNVERRRLVASLYKAGLSLRQIAAQTGVTYQAVYQMLVRQGITMRPPGGNQGGHSRHRQ